MLELMTRGVAPKEEDSLNDDERRPLEKERQREEREEPRRKLKTVLTKGADITKSSPKGREKFEPNELVASISNTQETLSFTSDDIPSTGLHLTNDGSRSRTDVDMVGANTKESAESLCKYQILLHCIVFIRLNSYAFTNFRALQ